MTSRRAIISRVGVLAFFLMVRCASSAVVLYTDRTVWQASQQVVHDFPLTAANVLLALEVTSTPTNVALLAPTLTFPNSLTGLPTSFQLRTIEPGSQFTFRTLMAGPGLQAGDLISHGECDWDSTFTGPAQVRGFGFNLIDNEFGPDAIRVYGASNALLATFPGPFDEDTFLGVTSTVPISRVAYDNTPNDDNFFSDLVIGTPAIPEPSTAAGVVLLLLTAGFNRRRSVTSMKLGINLDKPVRARKVGNEFVG